MKGIPLKSRSSPPDPLPHAGEGNERLPPSKEDVPRFGRPRDWLIGGLLLLLLVGWVEHSVGWTKLLAPWSTLSPSSLAGLFLLSTLSYLLRAVRVYDFFLPMTQGRFLATLRLSVLHNVANNLLPMRIGEAAFPLLMRRYFSQRLMTSSFALVAIRLMDLHFLGLVVIAALYAKWGGALWLLTAAGWLLLLPAAFAIRASILRWALAGKGRLRTLLAEAVAALPAAPARIARVYLWTALSWTAKVVAFAAVLRHFVPLELWQALGGIIGAELSSILPVHGIAGTGSYEAAAVAVLVPLGVDAATALAGAVNLHLFLLGVTVLLGLLGLLVPRR